MNLSEYEKSIQNRLEKNAADYRLNSQELIRVKKRQERKQSKEINRWLVKHFSGKETASISFQLYRREMDTLGRQTAFRGNDWLVEDTAVKIAKRYSNELNRFLYGNATRRYGKKIKLAVCFHNDCNPHLHIISEVDESRGGVSALKEFTESFCLESFNKFKDVLPKVYVEKTISVRDSLNYNNDDDKARGWNQDDGKVRGWDFLEGMESLILVE